MADVSRALPHVPRAYRDATTPALGGGERVTADWAFCRWLAIEHGVAAIPSAPFFSAATRARNARAQARGEQRRALSGGDGGTGGVGAEDDDDGGVGAACLVRFAFCKTDETLDDAARRLGKMARALRAAAGEVGEPAAAVREEADAVAVESM